VEIVREAWRDFVSGTTRGLVALAVFALVVAALGGVAVRSVVGLTQEAARFRAAGGSIAMLAAPGGIDGAQCDALVSAPGVVAAGALRNGPELELAVLPSRRLGTFEATAGFGRLLDIDRGSEGTGLGLWLAADLASVLGIGPGSAVGLASGDSARVDGVYQYPNDGRDPMLTYTAIAQVPAVGVFDACWADLWPDTARGSSLMMLAVLTDAANGGEAQVGIDQLNSTMGTVFNPRDRFEALPLQVLGLLGLVFGAVAGFVQVRVRRLQIASSLHAGSSKATQMLQILTETAIWLVPAILLTLPITRWLAIYANPDPPWVAWCPALVVTALAAIGVLIGSLTAVLTTREHHLYRYFKAR
jgi:hypothetical protein